MTMCLHDDGYFLALIPFDKPNLASSSSSSHGSLLLHLGAGAAGGTNPGVSEKNTWKWLFFSWWKPDKLGFSRQGFNSWHYGSFWLWIFLRLYQDTLCFVVYLTSDQSSIAPIRNLGISAETFIISIVRVRRHCDNGFLRLYWAVVM